MLKLPNALSFLAVQSSASELSKLKLQSCAKKTNMHGWRGE